VALSLVASIVGIANRFAYDDGALIATNDRVHSMHDWWMRFTEPYWPEAFAHTLYRPITMLGFTIQWTLGAGSPFVFHVTSIFLYALCALGMLLLAREILSPSAAWLAAAIFAVHPVHVEAVANVAGQSELLAGASLIFGAWWYVRARNAGAMSARDVGVVSMLYAFGLLSKESAIVLPALLVAAELTVLRKPGVRTRASSWFPTLAVLAIVAVGALCLRRAVIGAWLGDSPVPALKSLSPGERILTMLAASREWVRLLVWPSRLSFSYSPPYLAIVKTVNPQILPGAALLLVVIVSIAAAYRRAPAIAFGVMWLAVALLPVSNVFFVTGVFVAERTLFAPSVGFAVAVAGLVQLLSSRLPSIEVRRVAVGVLGVALIGGAMRSATRSRDWFDTAHITTAGVRDLSDAYTVNALYGEFLATQGGAAGTAEKWLRRAITLYPDDPEARVELANLYVNAGLWPAAESTFREALAVDPGLASARAGVVLCRIQAKDFAGAREQATLGVASGESVDTFKRLLAAIDSASKSR
jgi:protein O-mannosyl-transferase